MAPRPVMICACGEHAFVPLTRGFLAIFDPEFAPSVGLWSWHALSDGRKWYPARNHHEIVGNRRITITIRLHSMVLPGTAGYPVDHRDGNTMDNRRSNLRLSTVSANAMNQKTRVGTSKFRGVSRGSSAGWKAVIGEGGRQYYLGKFTSEEEAARAYDEAAVRLHGEFARLNFPRSEAA